MQAGIDYFGPQPPLNHEFYGGFLDSMMGDGHLKKGRMDSYVDKIGNLTVLVVLTVFFNRF